MRLVACWLVVGSGMLAAVLVRPWLGPIPWLHVAAVCLFASAKLATLLRLDPDRRRQLRGGRLLAYLAWSGLRPQPFLPGAGPMPPVRHPLWLTALANLLAGGLLFWGLPHLLPAATPFAVRMAVALTGFALMVLFGLLDAWAWLYRRAGVPVEKLWDNPLLSRSLADLWGRRWNRVFIGFARDLIFLPLSPRLGARGAAALVFLFACVVHEWAWSVVVLAGYGGPTLYFLIQGAGFLIEGTRPGRRWLRRGPAGRLWTAAVALLPLPLLLHRPLLTDFAADYFTLLGVPGLLSESPFPLSVFSAARSIVRGTGLWSGPVSSSPPAARSPSGYVASRADTSCNAIPPLQRMQRKCDSPHAPPASPSSSFARP